MDRFKKCLNFVLKSEGGFVNNPNDKGGMTYKGICRKYYPDLEIWKICDVLLELGKTPKEINEQLKNENQDEINNIYKKNYWDKLDCDNKEKPFDLICFDTAVNMGVARAKQFLKETNNCSSYIQLRVNYYKKIVENNPSQEVFLNGWFNRVKELCKQCDVQLFYIDF